MLRSRLTRAFSIALLVTAIAASDAAAGPRIASRRARPKADAAEPAIPLGAAVWFACTQPVWTGPITLRCPLPYNPLYAQTFLENFQRLTPENEFKMQYIEPEQGHYDFTVADEVAAFARANDKTIRGHTLIWDEQNPWWLTHPLFRWTRASLIPIMRSYITTVVEHFASLYPGVVTEWDVVNEPLTASGTLAYSPWEAAIGPDYILLALQYAHAADPSARLVVNDNADDVPGPKAQAMLALAKDLKAAGAPLGAIGFEAHVTPVTAPTYQQLVSLWDEYKQAGIDVEVTELDVDNPPGEVADPAAKTAIFERYAKACRVVGNCVGFTVWGVADSYSWLGANSDALLYNGAFQPTPAAAIVHKLLAAVPAVRQVKAKQGTRAPKACR